MDLSVSMVSGPLERRDEPLVLRNVVCCDADRSAEFFDQRAIRLLDTDAVAGGPRVAASAAVDVRDDHGAG